MLIKIPVSATYYAENLEKWALFQWDHIRARELISCSFFMSISTKHSQTNLIK